MIDDSFGQWYDKYRKQFGCKNSCRICWCEVCDHICIGLDEVVKVLDKEAANAAKGGE